MTPILVENGELALKEIQKCRGNGDTISLSILDSQMPGMNGFELAKKIKAAKGDFGSIVMMQNAAGTRDKSIKGSDMGISCTLTKPLRYPDLHDAILSALGISTPKKKSSDDKNKKANLSRQNTCLRILLAEDNLINQKVGCRLLENQGHRVVVAGNGEEALQALNEQSFDIVLMDVQMPKLDGFKATGRIREKEKNTGEHMPIIAMTAHAVKGDRERCLRAGMDEYVSKPLQPEQLLDTIDKAVKTSRRSCSMEMAR